MKKVRCILADDEVLSVELLQSYVLKLDNYEVVAMCRNGMEVYNALKTLEADLLFLDIEMPKLTGIELIKSLKSIPPTIITTAFREYAVEGFEHNAVDYILKPVSFERFLKAVNKFENLHLPSGLKPVQQSSINQETSNPFLYVSSGKKTVKVFLKDILFIEGAKQSVNVRTLTDEISTHQTLYDFEQRLPDSKFLRIHRSYIIAIDHIRAYNATMVQVGNVELPIGLSYQRSVAKALQV